MPAPNPPISTANLPQLCDGAKLTGHVPGQGLLPPPAPFCFQVVVLRLFWSLSDLLTYIWLLGREAEMLCQRSSSLLGSKSGRREKRGRCPPQQGLSRVGFLLLALPGQLWQQSSCHVLFFAVVLGGWSEKLKDF